MMNRHIHELILIALYINIAISQQSVTVSYDLMIPARPPDRIRPTQGVRPVTSRPRQPLPSDGGSRYLRRRKPGRKNLDRGYLMELMGDDYQVLWMSDEKPKNLMIPTPSHEVNIDDIPGRWAQERLLEQTQELNLTAELASLQPELLPYQHTIRSWLLKRSSCFVEFSWRDLGPTFWPRWVRKGDCVERKVSCSFPPGMHCVPAATTTVHILRWKCRNKKTTIVQKSADGTKEERVRNVKIAKDGLYRRRVPDIAPEQEKGKRKRCNWYKVPYPITIDCFCTC